MKRYSLGDIVVRVVAVVLLTGAMVAVYGWLLGLAGGAFFAGAWLWKDHRAHR